MQILLYKNATFFDIICILSKKSLYQAMSVRIK